MAANPTYAQFVGTHGGKSTSKLAKLWDTRFNGGQRFGAAPSRYGAVTPGDGTTDPTAAATQPPAAFDPSVLDSQGESELNDLGTNHNRRLSNIDTDYQTGTAELNAQRPLLERTRNEGYESADNNAAARGVFRSGIRDMNRSKVFTNYSDSVQALGRRQTALNTQHQRNLDDENASFNTNSINIRGNAAQRRWDQWSRDRSA